MLDRYEGKSRLGLECIGVKRRCYRWYLAEALGGVFDMLTDAVRDQIGESGRFGDDVGQVFKRCCTAVLPPPMPLGWVCGVSRMCMPERVIVKRKARIKAGFIGFFWFVGMSKK
ncbi:hypothetical protein XFUD_12120 [Xylella fastidiosa]|nr:hypothetical protein XFUD_12120 [Xylella fastidiosa]